MAQNPAREATQGAHQDSQQQTQQQQQRHQQRLSAIAHVAAHLTETELRIAIALAATADDQGVSIASNAELIRMTGVSRSAVIVGTKTLADKHQVARSKASSTKPSAYLCNFLQPRPITPLTGPNFGPPPVQNLDPPRTQPVQTLDPPRSRTWTPTGPNFGPLTPDEGDAGTRVDPIDSDSDSIDRRNQAQAIRNEAAEAEASAAMLDGPGAILRAINAARPADFEPAVFSAARKWLHGYAAKLGGTTLNELGQRIHKQPNPHAPDDRLIASFLAVAPWPTLERLLYDLLGERQEAGERYGWFVSVALQRIHGIAPEEQRRRRAELRLLRRGLPHFEAQTPHSEPQPSEIASNCCTFDPDAEQLRPDRDDGSAGTRPSGVPDPPHFSTSDASLEMRAPQRSPGPAEENAAVHLEAAAAAPVDPASTPAAASAAIVPFRPTEGPEARTPHASTPAADAAIAEQSSSYRVFPEAPAAAAPEAGQQQRSGLRPASCPAAAALGCTPPHAAHSRPASEPVDAPGGPASRHGPGVDAMHGGASPPLATARAPAAPPGSLPLVGASAEMEEAQAQARAPTAEQLRAAMAAAAEKKGWPR